MRVATRIACLALALSSAACEKYSFVPGEVTIPPPEGFHGEVAVGTFHVTADSEGYSSMKGGACLIFQAVDEPVTQCSDSGICNRGHGASASSPQELTGKDTVLTQRVGIDHKPPTAISQSRTGTGVPKTQIVVTAHPLGLQQAVRWRVVTCQNITERGCADPNATEGVNKKTRYGSVADVPARP